MLCSLFEIFPSEAVTLDYGDLANITFSCPDVIIDNGPHHYNHKDKDCPIEVGNIWTWCNWKEHEDEQDQLGRQSPTVQSQ